jgi:hypothetical protein
VALRVFVVMDLTTVAQDVLLTATPLLCVENIARRVRCLVV